ncbi:MAG: hypothetical protein ACM3Q2_10535 [Syntrophothermus sp.]
MKTFQQLVLSALLIVVISLVLILGAIKIDQTMPQDIKISSGIVMGLLMGFFVAYRLARKWYAKKLFGVYDSCMIEVKALRNKIEKKELELKQSNKAYYLLSDEYNIIYGKYQKMDKINDSQEKLISELREQNNQQGRQIKIAAEKLALAIQIKSALRNDLSKAIKRCETQIKEDARKSLEHERTARSLIKARKQLKDLGVDTDEPETNTWTRLVEDDIPAVRLEKSVA